MDRLKEAGLGVKDSQIVKILSGPNDHVQINAGSFAVTGQEPGSYNGDVINASGAKVSSSFQLANQYVTQCVSGACTPGQFVLVEDANVYGELVDFEGKK